MDGQLTLFTGKKFDASPLESQLIGSIKVAELATWVREVYVFGTNRPYPGCFLFRRKAPASDNEVLDRIWPIVEQENAKGSPHARIARHMLVVMPASSPELQRTSKRTFVRRVIEDAFAAEIDSAYRRQSRPERAQKPLDIAQIMENVYRLVEEKVVGNIPGAELPAEEDLHALGADSVAIMEIREQIQQDYGQALGVEFPPNVVYDCGSAEGLARHIVELYEGSGAEEAGDNAATMEELVERFTGENF